MSKPKGLTLYALNAAGDGSVGPAINWVCRNAIRQGWRDHDPGYGLLPVRLNPERVWELAAGNSRFWPLTRSNREGWHQPVLEGECGKYGYARIIEDDSIDYEHAAILWPGGSHG